MENMYADKSNNQCEIKSDNVFFDKKGRIIIDDNKASAFLNEYLSNEKNKVIFLGNSKRPFGTIVNINCPCGLNEEKET